MISAEALAYPDIWTAIAEFQRRAPVIRKTETVDTGKMSYNFAGLAKVWEEISALLDELGLVWSSRPDLETLDGGQSRFVLRYRLHHLPTGDSLDGAYPLKGERPQELGSSITYARRYALVAVLNLIVAEDDDDARATEEGGNRSVSQQARGGRRSAQRAPARPRQAPPATEDPTPEPANPNAPMTDLQRPRMFAALREVGYTERPKIQEFINGVLREHGAPEVTSSSELTVERCGWVIDAAEKAKERANRPAEEEGESNG